MSTHRLPPDQVADDDWPMPELISRLTLEQLCALTSDLLTARRADLAGPRHERMVADESAASPEQRTEQAVRSRMVELDSEPGAHERHRHRRLSLQRWADDPAHTARQAAEFWLLSRLPVYADDPPSWEL